MIAETSPLALALSWALVHFLWQGAAIALVTFALWRLLRLTAAARYQVGVAALAAMLLAPCVTTMWLMERQPARVAAGAIATNDDGAPATSSSTGVAVAGVSPVVPESPRASNLGLMAVLVAWLAGVTVLSTRLFGGWILARRLVSRNVTPVPQAIEVVARRVAARLFVDRAVRVLESSAVTVPVMVGWAKPVVLMPASALTGLSPIQIEALLAHELAHVRRLDYLVNLVQSAVETLLFYHPAVWWLSREVRIEREHCCDDLAVEVCDRLEYVTALTTLASMATPRLALAATDGSLVRRVRRLLGPGAPEQGSASGWVAAILGAAILAGAPVALTTARERDRDRDRPTTTGSEAIASPQPETPPAQEAVPEPAQKAAPVEVPGEVTPEGITRQQREASRDGELFQAQQRAEAQAAAARLQEAVEALRRLARDQAELQLRAASRETQSAIQSLERELAELEREQARVQRSYEVGLLSKDTVLENAARIAATQQKIIDIKAALDLRQQEIVLEQRRTDLERERQVALEALMRAQDGTKYGLSADQAATEQERLRRLQEQVATQALRQQLERERLTTVTDPAATARASDVIDIAIQGEPDLPPSYVVQENGTIRLPLLEAIKVAGLTTAQIEAAIRKQLSRLSTKVDLEVVIRRR